MKKLLIIFILIPIFSLGQEDKRNDFDTFQKAGNTPIRINFKPGHKGTPYLYNKWKTGYLVINDSIISPQERIQLNLSIGDLIIGTGKNKETGFVITDKNITGFAIFNEAASTQKVVFAKIDSSEFKDLSNKSKFYEVVSNNENNNYLIKEESKYLFDPNKSRGYQTQNSFPQEWKMKTSYYIKDNSGKYVLIKLSKKSILKNLADKKGELKAYIDSRKINFSKAQDVARVLNYYHSL